ncbi:Bax inhibitor-1/YccA family protein [Rhizobium sp. KVB221]|uniref:Bax inhibitor-1/YccA family protein n=1 Tax=Rhizobium setariae TaxID=2801340 RepID=A0A937CQZ6_9HYPH|nr:Bax inhibitor-1/YccA family protein [Rhizobium setariae]MBL0374648.1 Bax inhibitor-1/YccA family protein [Rhizobium setariae]
MSDIRDFQTRMSNPALGRTDAEIDQGLRSYMLKVYNLMALGVALTGLVAYAFAEAAVSNGQLTAFGTAIFASPLRWVVLLAPLGLVFFLSFRIEKMSLFAAQLTFWIYAALVGASLASVFMVYTDASIVKTFAVTAASFAALSLYGYTTKRSLSAMGSFLMMGLFGLIIASVVNIFLKSSALDFAVSAIGVLVFAGLTAWDTQKIKEMYFEGDGFEAAGKKAIMGALNLYMDFINLFLFLLRFMGNKE